MIPVAILCGGKGTRIVRGTEDLPKPLVEVGGRPILWHVMALYAGQGMRDFVLMTGWQSDRVEAAASGFEEVSSGAWNVTCIDTGVDTQTAGRVLRAKNVLDSGTFALTYADGVADIELGAEFDFHREHGKIATMTVVRPVSPWGKARIDDDGRITGFTEKPRLESWINGGFMILEPQVFEYIEHDEPFEEGPLARLAAADELFAFRHDGFWDCMDTFKDALVLNDLCRDNQTPPWLTARTAAHEGSVR